jgi:hypothetical protein
MRKRMTRKQVELFAERWRRANRAQEEELRHTDPEVKLRQFAALMASVDALGWRETLAEGVEEVRERWRRLRSHYSV